MVFQKNYKFDKAKCGKKGKSGLISSSVTCKSDSEDDLSANESNEHSKAGEVVTAKQYDVMVDKYNKLKSKYQKSLDRITKLHWQMGKLVDLNIELQDHMRTYRNKGNSYHLGGGILPAERGLQ